MSSQTAKASDPLFFGTLPLAAGIGLRHPHVAAFLEEPKPKIAWLEVHSENYLSPGGPRVRALDAIRRDYPISFHGVGLSLGSAEGLDEAHLQRLKAAFDRFQPAMISEHLSWSVTDGTYLNDLLPLPYTQESLAVLCRNIARAQDFFGRRILVENPSSYLAFAISEMSEWDFLAELAERTGCGLLLDVNNVYVSAVNHGFDAKAYLAALPAEAVGEIHLAGHLRHQIRDQVVLIDDHGDKVTDAVWALYGEALKRVGPKPTLIEWEAKIPTLDVLLAEAVKAQRLLAKAIEQGAAHVA